MRRASARILVAAAAVALTFTAGSGPVAAARAVSYEACVVERVPTAALMMLAGDGSHFELDLRTVQSNPFALAPGECVTVTGLDRDNEPGLRREYPRAAWLVEAQVISSPENHINRGSHSSNTDED